MASEQDARELADEREMRIMPVDVDRRRVARGERLVRVASIPWGMFDAHVAPRQALENHGQTLERCKHPVIGPVAQAA